MPIRNGHIQQTQPTHTAKNIEETRTWLYNNQFQNRRHKQLTKLRTRWVTALERQWQNNFIRVRMKRLVSNLSFIIFSPEKLTIDHCQVIAIKRKLMLDCTILFICFNRVFVCSVRSWENESYISE
jgi:O-methyltransferase involved in polyketide biosynthesis